MTVTHHQQVGEVFNYFLNNYSVISNGMYCSFSLRFNSHHLHKLSRRSHAFVDVLWTHC